MSSPALTPSSAPAAASAVAKTPFLAAAAFFLLAAALVFTLSIRPLGAAELVGLLACVAAASVFATIPFVLEHARRDQVPRPIAAPAPAAPVLDVPTLAAEISAAVEARLAASEDRRREELLRAAAAAASNATAPASGSRPPLDAGQIAAPAAAAKPRLGRGLASLIHNPSALAAKPPAPESDPRAGGEDERAAA